jgi:hypothetical protein
MTVKRLEVRGEATPTAYRVFAGELFEYSCGQVILKNGRIIVSIMGTAG